ncbi:Eukaryotic rpb5 RNA polymerase subunit family protein [Perilla frutescens var. hirtella]|uniref:Eukaryotic rpb5 RNA polymerase subunit family protein n=1 Tax=Perilla frutescens var. hirtella TaxID=608512 RepID=A0AAD4JEW1_PERFH|nr:Eukaryotic rpb5 RNA polymerase subunit family protein [Perilla frutescens var. frutescens]KAH6832528.1 Eukaryotic rpb5 RNA polymerase subunit family protein [Perilla frutescens var. hirtella]
MDVDVAAAAADNFGSCLSSLLDNGTVESHRYYLARKTLLEMLRDRGFAVPNCEIEVSLEDFRSKHGPSPDVDGLRISSLHKDDPSIKALVLFCEPGIVKVNVIRGITARIVQEGLNRLILVVQSKITSQASKAVELLPFKVEIFQITDLLVNVTKHELKPKHQVLTNAEKEKLLKKFSIEEKQLPRMLQKDAIARYYALEKGQVVKVTYSGELTQLHVTYRCVW